MVPRSKFSGGVIVRTFHSKVGVRKRSAVLRQDRYRNTGIATPAHGHPLASICYPRIVNPLSTPPQQVLCHCCTGAKDPAPDILHPICLPLECSLLPLAFITSKYVFFASNTGCPNCSGNFYHGFHTSFISLYSLYTPFSMLSE